MEVIMEHPTAELQQQQQPNHPIHQMPLVIINGNGHGHSNNKKEEDAAAADDVLSTPTAVRTKSDAKAGFLRAARDGHLDKVLEHLKNNTDINTSNANGLNALHLASKDGHVDIVTELLARGAVVDSATKKGNTALHIASLAGKDEVVKILVLNGASVNVQSQNGFTPLYMAAQENHDAVVRFLLANGANQSLATEDGFTPLAVALQQGHDKVVSVLLENDTRGKVRLPALHIAAKKDDCKAAALLLQSDHNPDVTSKSGFTPLHIAAHYGNENIASLLVQKGADVNFLAKHHITPLHVAAKWGKANMATLLLDRHANLEAKTRDGLTPLHCAARSGHETVVDLLLDRGAPISSKTKNGLAPLHMAAQGDHVDAARILLHHKAPVDEVTVDYLTALHVAAHCGHVRVAKLLLDRKADANSRALNGFTPLHIACKKNRIKVVELLLKHGASIEATTESGLTPLHVASFMGCMNIVIYLLQHGASANAPTMRGETPLHLAARANQTDIVRILLRNNAQVDARAREQQTPLHIASRLGNTDIVTLLVQHGAEVDTATKDQYTPLHIAAKEGQDEVAAVLLEQGASPTAQTKRGFTPLHLAAKYGNMKVAKLLIQKDSPVDAQGKNGVTPLHVASHYDHQNVALLLLDKGASPHSAAKNGYTPLHIAAKKNQMDIATTLLEYGANTNADSKAGFTPLHLSAQEGHTDMSTLLLEHQADPNSQSKNGLTPLHLCAQEDRVNVAAILVKNEAEINNQTKSGYTPLHVASHFGQMNMVRFLLGHRCKVDSVTSQGYTPLHQAAQQGHPMIVSLLLESGAEPNVVTGQGQTALSIAQKLGYITVIETLKVVTETTITTTTTTIIEEKYRVQAPETMQETFMSDSEDEGGEDGVMGDQSYRYLTVDEMKSLGDDSMPMDGVGDDRRNSGIEEHILSAKDGYAQFSGNYAPDNVDLARQPINIGFLVSFMVDARGGAMRGCRHSGVRVIIPPRKAPCPMRITCRYLKREKLIHPPPLMEGEALASRILELGPSAAKFLGPVIIEVPHFAALRGKEREIVVLRSDNGETWKEHTLEATEEAVQEVLNESFDGEDMGQLEDMNTHRITRILTTDFPQYFAIVSRVRQEVHAIGPDGGMVSSTVVPQVQAVFPPGALTKKIKVGLQAQPIQPELVVKLLGNRVAVSPIVTVEPRRRKFHKPITLTIPVPQAAARGMINQYSGDTPTLRLLCSITGGTSRAQWEDVTGSTPLTFVNDCVSFTTTVSARFWLMDCRNVSEAAKMATDLYREAINVPFMAKFVVFAKRHEPQEGRLRVFCMTDDKEEKTLEQQEHFVEVAKSRDVEVLESKSQYLEFAGNLVPVTKSGEQLALTFRAFRENRLPFTVRVKDGHAEPIGRVAFMREARASRGEPPQTPICNLNIVLPSVVTPDSARSEPDLTALHKKYGFLHDIGLVYATNKPEAIHKADLRLSDICNLLGRDWIPLGKCLEIPESDINLIESEYPNNTTQQAMVMLKLWMAQSGNRVTGNTLEKALRKIGRDDIVNQCIFNVELVTDDLEKAVAKTRLDQPGFDQLRAEVATPVSDAGSIGGGNRQTRDIERNPSLDVSFDEQDLMKESESIEEIPEKRDEEEKLHRVLASPELADMKSPDQSSSSGRIVPEEKGIFDSREAEKDEEIPQPLNEKQSQRPVLENVISTSTSCDSDAWGTRQSTVEERVIDRYVIDTHQASEPEVPEQLIEEPEVLISSSWGGQAAPTDDESFTAVTQEQFNDYEEDATAAAQLELEFSAALSDDRNLVDSNAFSAELLSRSLQQPNSESSFVMPSFSEGIQEEDEEARLAQSEICNSENVNRIVDQLSAEPEPEPLSESALEYAREIEEHKPLSEFEYEERGIEEPPVVLEPESERKIEVKEPEYTSSHTSSSPLPVATEQQEIYQPSASTQDARLTSAGNNAASVHHKPMMDTNPTFLPEAAQSRIPVLSDRRSNLSRSVSESMSASRLPVPVKASGTGGGQHHTLSRFMSADQSTDVQQQETSSYSVRKQFWEEVASASSSTSSISSATGSTGAGSSRREVRQTKSERSSLVVTDESFSATSGDVGELQPQNQRQTSTSQRSSAILSEEEDIYESERGVYTSVTKTSTSEMLETSHQVAEEQESGKLVVAQQEREQIETVQVTTERTGDTVELGSTSTAIEGETEVTVTGSSQRHRQRIGLEEYVYSSGDESVSMRAEDVESESGVVLPCGRQLVTEQFARSSKTVYKDGQPIFVEQSSSGSQHPQPDEQLQHSTPSLQSDSFEETPPTSTVGHGDSVEVNVGSLEQLPADVSVAIATASTSDSEPEQEEMAFVNTGFIGVDHIDTVESLSSIAARSVSPFEVPREETYVIGTYEPPEYEDGIPAEQLRRCDSFDSRDLEVYGGATDAEGFSAPELEHEPEYERRLTPQEALLIAENIIEEIKAEAPRRAEMMNEQTAAAAVAAKANEHSSSSATEALEQTESYITEYIQQLPPDSGQEEEMDDSCFSAFQQKEIPYAGRRESSFDITDEELRSSFSAADMTPPMVVADQKEEEEQVQLDAVDRTLSQVRENLELDQVAEEATVAAASATSPPALFSPERETMSTPSSGSRLDSASVGFYTKREETEETLYYSAVGSTGAAGGQQSSRPTSSDVDALLSAGTTVGSSEYETAFSPSSSSHSAVTLSGDFHSAISSVSSRDSMKSLESSATDASETLMASAVEHQHPDDCDLTPTTDASLDLNQMNDVDEQQQRDEACPESPFEMVSAEVIVDEGLSEVIEGDEDGEPGTPRMKRSQEMTFHPEPKPLRSGEPSSPPATPTPSEESPCLVETTGPTLFDYVAAANFSTSTMRSDDTGSTPSTVIEAEKPVDQQPPQQQIQEKEITTHHDVSTITSRSSSLASATDVTITSSTIARRESCPEQTMSTQITTQRAPNEPLPNITVQHASPINNERRFSYPPETEVAPVMTNVIEEVSSDQEEEEDGYGFVAGDTAENEDVQFLPEPVYDDDEIPSEEQQGIAIEYPEVEVEDLQSPPGLVAKRIDPPLIAGYNYEMSFEKGEDEELDEELRPVGAEEDVELTEEDLEKQKRWMEMQFEEAEDAAEEVFGQLPPRAVQLLADIEEGREDEESLNGSDRSGLAGRLKESSLSSTPEFDVLSGRRYFSRNAAGGAAGGNGGEDVMSVDSLQDFERLEQELQAVKLRRQSNGSQESLNGSGKRVGGDNVSVNSLTEFERLERDMAEAAKIEERARQQEAALLSEIEEGHESQQSESSDSCETLSGGGLRRGRGGDDTDGDESDDEDYEQRMFEIDEIIRQAQTNIEQFDTDLAVQIQQEATTTQHHSMVRFESTSSTAEGMTRSSIMDSDSMDSIEPDLGIIASSGSGSATSRTAATYRTFIRTTEVKYGSEEQQPDSLAGAPDSLEVFGPSSVDSLDSASNAGRSRSGPHDSDSIAAMAGAQSSSNSSSAREELPRDLIQRSSVTAHKMVTSSDSLEVTGSSSAGFTSDSIMSSSMTSSSGCSAAAGLMSTETSRTVEMNPEIRKVTFRGTDVDEQMKEFVNRFAPGEDIREVEVTDPRTGSIFVTRLVQRRTVVDASELPSASGEPNDLPSIQALEEYIRARGPQLEHVDSFEMDDGMGNVQRVIRKRVVAQPLDGSSSTDSTLPPNASLAFPQYPSQVTQPVESTPLPELTSSGAETEDQGASLAYHQYDPSCSAISASEPSLPSQPEWSDGAQGGN